MLAAFHVDFTLRAARTLAWTLESRETGLIDPTLVFMTAVKVHNDNINFKLIYKSTLRELANTGSNTNKKITDCKVQRLELYHKN